MIAWSEFGSYFGGYIDKQYGVDKEIRETVQINMDLYVRMPCQWIHVNARDETMDRKLVSEDLVLEEMPFFVPGNTKIDNLNNIVTPNLDEILGEAIPAQFIEKLDTAVHLDADGKPKYELDGCHIYGSMKVNRVSGELQITAKGYGYRGSMRTPVEKINFNHVINEFSFGDFYPYIDNPLDGTGKIEPEKPKTTYVYFTSVVPTIYQKLGAQVDTNQYSISEYQYDNENANMKEVRRTPGIFFKYDFEPLSILISDKRLSFTQFIIRLVAILSFVLYMFSWLFRGVDMLLVSFLGPKWSLRYQPANANPSLL